MRIEKEHWDVLPTVLSGGGAHPPEPVHSAVVAMVDPARVTDSLVDYAAEGESTSWRVWLVTDTAFAYIELQFDVANYDANEEDFLRKQRALPSTNVMAMWTRPLTRIIEFSVADIGALRNSGIETRVWFSQETSIAFDDGHTVPLPSQTKLHDPADRARSDDFLAAVRAAVVGGPR